MGKFNIPEKKIISDKESFFKKGLSYQRERFKEGKSGKGLNNFDLMCDALENLKSDLKSKVIKSGNKKTILRIEKIIQWYRTLESKYTKNTEDGPQVVFPSDIYWKINKNLTIGYELMIEEMDNLDLL